MTFPLHPDFNDRKMGRCDRYGHVELLLSKIDKGLCPQCYKTLLRDGGLVAYTG